MTSIQTLAPRDDVRSFVVKIEAPNGERAEIPVSYYRSRITLAPVALPLSEEEREALTDGEISSAETASTICYYLKSWEVEGPLYDSVGAEIVGAGEMIPLEPLIVMHVPSLVIGEVMRQLTEHVFPPTTKSRNERRRSR